MNIGIIGSGQVAQALAKGFIEEGHKVMIGTRDFLKPDIVGLKDTYTQLKLGSFSDAASFADAVVLATKGEAAIDALHLAGAENLENKIIMDATNPIANAAPENGVLRFFTSLEESLMERLQIAFPQSKFVKVFNSVGNALMYKPVLQGGKPSMFICGNDKVAKQTVSEILSSFGWETEDMGSVTAARAIEPLCILWCLPGFLNNQWTHAFKLLKP